MFTIVETEESVRLTAIIGLYGSSPLRTNNLLLYLSKYIPLGYPSPDSTKIEYVILLMFTLNILSASQSETYKFPELSEVISLSNCFSVISTSKTIVPVKRSKPIIPVFTPILLATYKIFSTMCNPAVCSNSVLKYSC